MHVRLDGATLDRKVAALRAMATQTGDAVAGLGLETYAELNAEEAFVAAAPRPLHQSPLLRGDGTTLADGGRPVDMEGSAWRPRSRSITPVEG